MKLEQEEMELLEEILRNSLTDLDYKPTSIQRKSLSVNTVKLKITKEL